MQIDITLLTGLVYRLCVLAILLISGLLIFVLGSGYYTIFPTNKSAIYKISLPILFLVSTLLLVRKDEFNNYWQVSYAFLVASSANFLSWYFGPRILHALKMSGDTFKGIALAKLAEAVVVIGTILALSIIAGVDMDSIYFHVGAIKLGIAIGLISIVVFVAIAALQARSLNIQLNTVLSLLPWIVTFALANAFMEELWFRGIFLKKFELLLGSTPSLLLTSIIFTIAHIGASYYSRSERIQFLIILFPLALAWGYFMQKTDSLLGSVLSHAGADLIIINGFIAALHDEDGQNSKGM